MPMISIANDFDEKRAMFNRPMLGPFECLSHLIHIVALNTEAWDHIASFIKVCVH